MQTVDCPQLIQDVYSITFATARQFFWWQSDMWIILYEWLSFLKWLWILLFKLNDRLWIPFSCDQPSASLYVWNFWLIKGRGAPSSALPIGASSSQDPLRLSPVLINNELFSCLLAVSHAKTLDEVLSASIAGFVYIQSVDIDDDGNGTVTYLSPGPGKLPGRFLLMGSIEILNFSWSKGWRIRLSFSVQPGWTNTFLDYLQELVFELREVVRLYFPVCRSLEHWKHFLDDMRQITFTSKTAFADYD